MQLVADAKIMTINWINAYNYMYTYVEKEYFLDKINNYVITTSMELFSILLNNILTILQIITHEKLCLCVYFLFVQFIRKTNTRPTCRNFLTLMLLPLACLDNLYNFKISTHLLNIYCFYLILNVNVCVCAIKVFLFLLESKRIQMTLGISSYRLGV